MRNATSGNLRQRKTTNVQPSQEPNNVAVKRRRRRRRRDDGEYRSWLLLAITLSIWLLLFSNWPREPGSKLDQHDHTAGQKFHDQLRRRNKLLVEHPNHKNAIGKQHDHDHDAIRTEASKDASRQDITRNNITEQKEIKCSDGKSKGILNDDYCDCPDGSDEPSTAACSHILVQRKSFGCMDGITFIFPSRVHDGIDDCPDGSDERF